MKFFLLTIIIIILKIILGIMGVIEAVIRLISNYKIKIGIFGCIIVTFLRFDNKLTMYFITAVFIAIPIIYDSIVQLAGMGVATLEEKIFSREIEEVE